MKRGTKFYKLASDFKLLAFSFVKEEGKFFYLEHNGQILKKNREFMKSLGLSPIIVMNEANEKLTEDLKKLHFQMREYKMKFYPINDVNVVYAHRVREVHQYDKQGDYIQSFTSIKNALVHLGVKNMKNSSISQVCQNKPEYRTAFGFKWSFFKFKTLV